MDTTQKLEGIVQVSNITVTPDGGPARAFTLNLDFSDCTIEDAVELAARPRIITWANTNRNKKNFYKLPTVIEIRVKPIGTRETKVVSIEKVSKDANRLSSDKKRELIALLNTQIDAENAADDINAAEKTEDILEAIVDEKTI